MTGWKMKAQKAEEMRYVILDRVQVVGYNPLNQNPDDQAKLRAAVAVLGAYSHATLVDGLGNRMQDVEAKLRQLDARWRAEAAA